MQKVQQCNPRRFRPGFLNTYPHWILYNISLNTYPYWILYKIFVRSHKSTFQTLKIKGYRGSGSREQNIRILLRLSSYKKLIFYMKSILKNRQKTLSCIRMYKKVFLKGWKVFLFVKFGPFPCSWIRIRIPNKDLDTGQPNECPDSDTQHCTNVSKTSVWDPTTFCKSGFSTFSKCRYQNPIVPNFRITLRGTHCL